MPIPVDRAADEPTIRSELQKRVKSVRRGVGMARCMQRNPPTLIEDNAQTLRVVATPADRPIYVLTDQQLRDDELASTSRHSASPRRDLRQMF